MKSCLFSEWDKVFLNQTHKIPLELYYDTHVKYSFDGITRQCLDDTEVDTEKIFKTLLPYLHPH